MRRRILPLLVLALCCMLLACAGAMHRMYQSRLDEVRRVTAPRAARIVEAEIDDYEQAMTAALEVMGHDVTMRHSLAAGDAEALYSEAKPLFERLRSQSRVTRFAFYTPGSVCVLRVHDRARPPGGLVNRAALAQAIRTGAPATGIERSAAGACFLHVVYPWHAGAEEGARGPVIGYVELGVPFRAMAEETRDLTGDDLLMVAAPRALDRQSATDSPADQPVLDTTLTQVEPSLLRRIARQLDGPKQFIHESDHGQRLLVEALPVRPFDAGAAAPGRLLVVRDITELSTEIARAMWIVGVACICVGAMLAVFFYRFLGRIERELHEKQQALERVNATLEQRVEQRTREITSRNAEHRAIVAAASDCMISMDHAGVITEFNPAAESTFGYRRDEVVGRPLEEVIIPPRLRHQHRQGLARFLESGQGKMIGQRSQVTAMRADGTEFEAEMALTVVRLDGPPAFTAYIRDITDRLSAEQAMKQSEQWLRAVIDTTPECVKTTTFDGRLLSINRAGLEMIGADSAEQLIGHSIYDLLDPAFTDAFGAMCERASSGERASAEFEIINLQGKRLRLETRAVAMRNPADGQMVQLALTRDVTASRAAQEAARKNEHRLAAINDCFLHFNADPIENISRLTRVCGELLGGDCALYSRLDGGMLHAVGQWNTPPDFQPMDRPQGHVCFDVMRQASTQPVIIRDLPATPYAKSDPNVSAFGLKTYIGQAVFTRGQAVGALCVVWTRDFEPAEPLKKLLGILAVAVGIEEDRRRAQAVERERAGLKEAVAGMEQVLGVVAHELRTPLAGLRAMSEFLLTDEARNTTEFDAFLKGINEEVVRMAETVNNLLEAARLNSGKARWNFHTLRLRHAGEEAIETIRPLIDSSSTQIVLAVEPADLEMRGDADAVRRLVINLLNNARKHTPRGRIQVTASARTDEGGDWIDLSVADSGAGMPPDVLSRLGEPFALNSGAIGINNINGTGLGLAICKGIVAAHGGRMQVRSVVGEGTTVTIQLRADLAAPVVDPPTAPKAAA